MAHGKRQINRSFTEDVSNKKQKRQSKISTSLLCVIRSGLFYFLAPTDELHRWVSRCSVYNPSSFLHWSSSKESISCLEDLCNELVYELFEYLTHVQVYEAFFNLNTRFHHLLTNSNSPINIDLSSLSKSVWKRYNEDIIECNMNRIRMFCISDTFMYDCVVSSLKRLLTFNRIECLILENIQFEYLENLLDQPFSLSHLSSLVITSNDVSNRAKIYGQIFRLPALKYCRLFLKGWNTNGSLPTCVDEYSPIERLVITNFVDLHEFDSLLSYLPHLRRISLDLYANYQKIRSTQRCPFVCKQLTHISLRLSYSIKFDIFEEVIRELFPMVEVLHLTLPCYFDRLYANAHKWEQLILSHLSYLRIFDIQCCLPAAYDVTPLRVDALINQFTTSFWTARQWSFTYQPYDNSSVADGLFYSANPYRYSLIVWKL